MAEKPCTGCGELTDESDMYFSENGEVCSICASNTGLLGSNPDETLMDSMSSGGEMPAGVLWVGVLILLNIVAMAFGLDICIY